MEAAIQTMVKVFLKSTKGKESLGKKEFQHLVENQLSNILSVRKSSLNLSEMLHALCKIKIGKMVCYNGGSFNNQISL